MQDQRQPIDPARVRQPPRSGFAWIDRRILRHGWIDKLEHDEILLYLFLLLAADKNGVSYWSLSSIARRLGLDSSRIEKARHGLLSRRLIIFRYLNWQILDVPEFPAHGQDPSPQRSDAARGRRGESDAKSIAEILAAAHEATRRAKRDPRES
jgi:hypothetical protein